MPNISILTEINSTNYLNLLQIYQPTVGYSGFITSLGLTINLKSIPSTNFPYIPDNTPPDVLEQLFENLETTAQFKELRILLKKGSGSWIERAKIRLFNKEPYYEIDLMPYFTKANTIDVAEDLSLGLQIKVGDALTANIDSIVVFGTVVEEKKNNGNEELAARIEALELALTGKLTNLPANTLLGRNTNSGIVETILQSTFAKTGDIENALITKANLAGSQTYSGIKTFLNRLLVADLMLADDPYANIAINVGKGYIKAASDFYEDYKTGINGSVRFRCGAGAEYGYTRQFMQIDGATGNIIFNSSTPATSTTAAAFRVNSVGVVQNLYVGGSLSVANLPTSPTGLSPGSLYRTGGAVNVVV